MKQKLTEDLKSAMKSADQTTVGVLRLLLAALKNKEIEKRSGNVDLTDEDVLRVILSEAKKRKDSIDIFRQGKREDLVLKEKEELAIIEKYLPQQLTVEEIEKAIDRVLSALPAKDFPVAMKSAMQELRGKADAKLVAEIIKKKISLIKNKIK